MRDRDAVPTFLCVFAIALCLLPFFLNAVSEDRDDLVLRVNLDEGGETYSVVIELGSGFDAVQYCGEPVTGTSVEGWSFSLVVECGDDDP